MLAADMPGDLLLLFCLMLRWGFFVVMSWMLKPEQLSPFQAKAHRPPCICKNVL